jgi:hypothetical protein
MTTQHRSARRAPIRPSTHRASWTEYQRLLTAGVNPTTAAVLASGQPRPDDERAYWRQLAHRTPTTPATRAAHATAQQQRRRAWSLTPTGARRWATEAVTEVSQVLEGSHLSSPLCGKS